MKSLSIGVFRGVKLLNFTVGVVVLFRSGVSENLGTFCLAGSCLRSSTSFRLFKGGSSRIRGRHYQTGHTPTVHNYQQWGRVQSLTGRIENGQDFRSNRAGRPQQLTTCHGTSQQRLRSEGRANATISQFGLTPNEWIPGSETHSDTPRTERSRKLISQISLVKWAEWWSRSRPTIKHTGNKGKFHWNRDLLDDANNLLLARRNTAGRLPWSQKNQGTCILIHHTTGDTVQKRFFPFPTLDAWRQPKRNMF